MNKAKKLKFIPKFRSEDEERDFWVSHDLTDYMHQFKPVKLDLSRLKPSTRPITIRLPETLLWSLKRMANKRDVPYQSLVKILLAEKVEEDSQVHNRRYH